VLFLRHKLLKWSILPSNNQTVDFLVSVSRIPKDLKIDILIASLLEVQTLARHCIVVLAVVEDRKVTSRAAVSWQRKLGE